MYSKKIVLHFPHLLVDKSVLYRMFKNYNIEFNILKASVTPNEQGLMILELKGDKKDYDGALQFLEKEGVTVERLSQDVIRDNARCTHCGACVTVCPVGAFTVDAHTREVSFTREKCIACEGCVEICPYHAMQIKF